MDVILGVLESTATKGEREWVLWAEQNALVLNPAYTFPFSKYTDAGHSIVMYGNPDDAAAGRVNGAGDILASPPAACVSGPAGILAIVPIALASAHVADSVEVLR